MLSLKNSHDDCIVIESDVFPVTNNINNTKVISLNNNLDTDIFILTEKLYYNDMDYDTYISNKDFINNPNSQYQKISLKLTLGCIGDKIKITKTSLYNIDFVVQTSSKTNYIFTDFDRQIITDNGIRIDILDLFKKHSNNYDNSIKYYNQIITNSNKLNTFKYSKFITDLCKFIKDNETITEEDSKFKFKSIKSIGKICLKSARMYYINNVKIN